MLVAISWVRLCAIRKPFQHNNAILSWKERRNYWLKYFIPIIISSVILTSPALLEIQDSPLPMNETYMVVTPTTVRLHPLYIVLYVGVLNLGILGWIPMVCLVYLAYHIRMELSKKREQRDRLGSFAHSSQVGINPIESSEDRINAVTRGLVSVIIAFIGCHTLRVLTTVAELYLILDQNEESSVFLSDGGIPKWFEISISLSEFFMVSNASVNVMIYLKPYIDINQLLEALLSRFRKTSNTRLLMTQATVEEFILMVDEPCARNNENEQENGNKKEAFQHEKSCSHAIPFPKVKSHSLTAEPSFDALQNITLRGSKGSIRRRSMLDKI